MKLLPPYTSNYWFLIVHYSSDNSWPDSSLVLHCCIGFLLLQLWFLEISFEICQQFILMLTIVFATQDIFYVQSYYQVPSLNSSQVSKRSLLTHKSKASALLLGSVSPVSRCENHLTSYYIHSSFLSAPRI